MLPVFVDTVVEGTWLPHTEKGTLLLHGAALSGLGSDVPRLMRMQS